MPRPPLRRSRLKARIAAAYGTLRVLEQALRAVSSALALGEGPASLPLKIKNQSIRWSDESDASSSSLAELRRRRLIREQGEGVRSAKLLAAREVAGESLPDGRGNRYNAQFFPDRARQR